MSAEADRPAEPPDAEAMGGFDLGTYTRLVSTTSPEAQRWFDLGLNWCFGFNHEEGVKCFLRALEFDPACVMAHWGVAYGSGPFYNLVWRDFGEQEAARSLVRATHHIQQARRHAAHATELENGLVAALAIRFGRLQPVPPEEYDRWDDDYAAEMRRLHYRFPDDHDVMALFAEALITRTPRRLWDVKTGQPAGKSDVVEALAVCERSVALAATQGRAAHPAVVHMHIHVLEMSGQPERAMPSADALATMCPDAGHMNHMPAHIYVLCGEYEKAREVSDVAIAADDRYAAYAGSLNFYVTARCHDLHLLMFTCMFLGQYRPALAAAEKIQGILTRDIIGVRDRPKLAMTTEGYYSMKMHVLVRFGQWQQIVDHELPDDPAMYPVSTAMHHYARGVAYASLKNIAAAELERHRFRDSLAQMPPGRRFLSNPALTTLGVGEKMLDGELEYHKGNYAEAFQHLRESVRRDDDLCYTEPWAWMHPPRHALAALLMEQGYLAEAEEVYRDDLGLSGRVQRCAQHPGNIWALHGLVECLQRRGETEELAVLQPALVSAMQKADVPITSSCLCRTTVAKAQPPCCGHRAG